MRPAFPRFELGAKQLGGQAAVDRLGARLGEIAGWYGKSAEDLRRQLLGDKRLRVDAKGRVFAIEEMTAPLAAAASATTQEPLLAGQLLPLDQTFALHSKPGSNRTIYLDFDGATLTDTAWNSNGNTINAPAFDIDGTPDSFTTAELQRIQFIWQRVAEDYAPFDVDVTTELPAPDRLSRSSTTDTTFGTTVLITSTTGVYDCSCGGIAYIGVFNDTSSHYKPALVFENMLGNGDEKAVAEAISHEAGHNMGLSHDGSATTAYYGGQGSDAFAWAPIMGVGYYKPVVQFSNGDYAGANNKEDDFAVAQSFGLPLRADDFGNAPASATALPAAGTIDGIIERVGDADVFSVAAAAGTLTVTVKPASRSANADLVVSLLNSAGTVLATNTSATSLGAGLSYQVPASGSYFIKVSATGHGDPSTTGYSSYGSRGNYRVAASFQAGVAAPTPVLAVSATSAIAPAAIKFDASKSYDSDGTVKFYYWDFGDGTSDRTGSLKSTTKTYSKAGKYIVRLTVVDSSGISASTTRTISVAGAASTTTLKLKSSTLTLSLTSNGYRAKDVLVITNQAGKVIANAAVSAKWSGVVTQSSTLKTNSMGQVTFLSPGTTARGCYTLTVTNIVLAGYTVDKTSLVAKKICR